MSSRDFPPELTSGPFLLSTALALGLSREVLRGKRFRSVFHGVHVRSDLPDSVRLRLDAARLLLPTAVGSHRTAADLRGLPVPPGDARVEVTLPPEASRPRIRGVAAHWAPSRTDVRTLRGRPVLSVERTLLDLAADGISLIDLVIFRDAAVRRGWTTCDSLVVVATAASGRGVRTARLAADLVRDRVDSPMETRLRLLLVLAGLPCPEVNRPINDMSGWLATPDLSCPNQKIAIEYDGDHHRTDRCQWSSDKQRRRQLRDLGWAVLECVADDVFRRADQTLAWAHRRLVAAGHPDVPLALSAGWRAHLR